MFGRRPQIKFRTGFNNSAVDALTSIAEDTLENIENFTQSPAVSSTVRGTKMAAPMSRVQKAAVDLMDAVMAFDNEYFGWLEDNDLTEETSEGMTIQLTEDHIKDLKKAIQKKFKKGDSIEYVDARTQKQHTGTYKGMKFMGGRSYAQVETGKELLALPVFQIVVDI